MIAGYYNELYDFTGNKKYCAMTLGNKETLKKYVSENTFDLKFMGYLEWMR